MAYILSLAPASRNQLEATAPTARFVALALAVLLTLPFVALIAERVNSHPLSLMRLVINHPPTKLPPDS
jgi:hypothetical protein